jgi:hypothetical protein
MEKRVEIVFPQEDERDDARENNHHHDGKNEE